MGPIKFIPPKASSAPGKPHASFHDTGRWGGALIQGEGPRRPGQVCADPATPLSLMQPKPVAWAPPSVAPAPQAEAEERPEVPAAAAARKDGGEPAKAAEEKRVPPAHGGPTERPRRESARKKSRKEARPQRAEKPLAAGAPPGAAPRRWGPREGGRRPWGQEARGPEHRKGQDWPSRRRPSEDERPPGRQKRRAGGRRD